MSQELADAVLANRVLTVFGPSGAGKSSLLQASLIPTLGHGLGLRCVTVDAWPPEQVLSLGPVSLLVAGLVDQLGLGELATGDLEEAVELAFYNSSRPVLLVLDQLEQLLVQHEREVLEDFILQLARLDAIRDGVLHILLALREDYLGRWSAMLAPYPHLSRHSFRVPRLSLDEALDAVIRASMQGAPPQHWPPDTLLPFLKDVTLPGEWRSDGEEVESAYVQIVCRALWAQGGPSRATARSAAEILERYLHDTLGGLGRLQREAQRLLETRLIHARSGRRIQVSRGEVADELGDAQDAAVILEHLEQARILRSQIWREEQLFELGHDWLAEPVRGALSQRQQALQRRRTLVWRGTLGGTLLVLALLVVVFAGLFLRAEDARASAEEAQTLTLLEKAATEAARADEALQREAAQTAQGLAEQETQRAETETRRARQQSQIARTARREAEELQLIAEQRAQAVLDNQYLLATQDLEQDPHRSMPFLSQVSDQGASGVWRGAVWRALQRPLGVPSAAIAPSRSVLVPVAGGAVALLGADSIPVLVAGDGTLRELDASPAERLAASPDGRWLAAADSLGGLRLWDIPAGTPPVAWTGHDRAVWSLAFNHSGTRLLTSSQDGVARTWRTDRPGEAAQTISAAGRIGSAVFVPPGEQVVTVTIEGQVAQWGADGQLVRELQATGQPGVGGHRAQIDGDGRQLAVVWSDQSIDTWDLQAGAQHTYALDVYVVDTVMHPSGALITLDKAGRLRIGEVALPDHDGPFSAMALSGDGALLATGAASGQAILWALDPRGQPLHRFVLAGHSPEAPVDALTFSGGSLVTASRADGLRRWPTDPTPLSERLPGVDGRIVEGLAIDNHGTITLRRANGSIARSEDATAPTPASTSQQLHTSPRIGEQVLGESTGDIRIHSGDTELELSEHFDAVRVLSRSPDGRWLASASEDGSVRRWFMHNDRELRDLLAAQRLPCISARDRVRYLGESEADAEASAQRCQALR